MVGVEGRTVVEVVVIGVVKVGLASLAFEQPVLIVVEDSAGAKVLVIYSVQPSVVTLVAELLAWFVAKQFVFDTVAHEVVEGA